MPRTKLHPSGDSNKKPSKQTPGTKAEKKSPIAMESLLEESDRDNSQLLIQYQETLADNLKLHSRKENSQFPAGIIRVVEMLETLFYFILGFLGLVKENRELNAKYDKLDRDYRELATKAEQVEMQLLAELSTVKVDVLNKLKSR